ncbi:MAG: acyl carrier protein [Alphaproteobacteria bacterium]|nr:acyl carrier protein [Alphaproteobacteria bacterium]MCZ6813951.1 acyl carrier protein [Alphaproteobacteria bacterium]
MSTTEQDIKAQIAELLKVPEERVEDETVLKELTTDSFLLVEMVIGLQEVFHVRLVQDDLREVQTVADLTSLFVSRA